MTHKALMFLLVIAARVGYAAGSLTGAVAMTCSGLLLELSVWIGVLRRRRQRLSIR